MRILITLTIMVGVLSLIPAQEKTIPGVTGSLGIVKEVPPINAAEVMALVADAFHKIDPNSAPYVVALSLHDLAYKDWDDWAAWTSGHLNTISRKRGIHKPVRIDGLLFIDLRDYGEILTKVWDKLEAVEPFFHDETVEAKDVLEDCEPYRASDGRVYRQRWVKQKKVIRGFAPWILETAKQKENAEFIFAKTKGRKVPVVYADWFIFQTAVDEDRNDLGFYAFTGIETIVDYEKAIGFVEDKIDPEFLNLLRAAVGGRGDGTGVVNPEVVRRIEHYNTVGGHYFRTRDTNLLKLKKEQQDKGNAKLELGDRLIFQAQETIGLNACGMVLTGLFNDKGVKQSSAPPFIANNKNSTSSDTRVHVNKSCYECHDDGMLQPLNDWVRGTINLPPALVGALDPKEAIKVREQYVEQRIEPYMDEFREKYKKALFEATGLTPAKYATLITRLWHERCELPVTLERAARDLGTTPDKFKHMLVTGGVTLNPKDPGYEMAVLKATIQQDPILAGYRHDPPRGLPSVAEWYQKISRAQDALRGIARPFDKDADPR